MFVQISSISNSAHGNLSNINLFIQFARDGGDHESQIKKFDVETDSGTECFPASVHVECLTVLRYLPTCFAVMFHLTVFIQF